MGDYGSKDFYKKPGPRFLDSEGVGPLSDVVNLVRGLGIGVGQAAADTARTAGMGGITVPAPEVQPKMISLIPGVTRGEAVGGEQYQKLYANGAVPTIDQRATAVAPANKWAMEMDDATYNKYAADHPHIFGRDEKGNRVILEGQRTDAQYEKMSDKEFEKAVGDVNKPGPAGIGYVKMGNKMERVYNQPGGIGGEIDLTGLNAKEVTALAHMKAAEHGDAIREQGMDLRREANDLKRAENEEKAFHKRVAFESPMVNTKVMGDDGVERVEKRPDVEFGMMKLALRGDKGAAHYKPRVAQIVSDFRENYRNKEAELRKADPKLKPLEKWTEEEILDYWHKQKTKHVK